MTKLKSAREDVSVVKTPAALSNGEARLSPGEQNPSTEFQSQEQSMDASEEAIRELAYQKWEEAGCPSGDGFDFWLDAEQAVMGGQWNLESMDT